MPRWPTSCAHCGAAFDPPPGSQLSYAWAPAFAPGEWWCRACENEWTRDHGEEVDFMDDLRWSEVLE